MEKYKDKIKKRMRLYTMLILACVVVLIITTSAARLGWDWFASLPDYGMGYAAGMCCAGVILLAANMAYLTRVLRNPDALKKAYIAETDERHALMRQKSAEVTYIVISVGITTAAAVCAFIDIKIFATLAVTTLFVAHVRLIAKVYYMRKMR